MGPWWLTWHLCLYICEKCEMSRLWHTDGRTHGHTDSRKVEQYSVGAESAIRVLAVSSDFGQEKMVENACSTPFIHFFQNRECRTIPWVTPTKKLMLKSFVYGLKSKKIRFSQLLLSFWWNISFHSRASLMGPYIFTSQDFKIYSDISFWHFYAHYTRASLGSCLDLRAS